MQRGIFKIRDRRRIILACVMALAIMLSGCGNKALVPQATEETEKTVTEKPTEPRQPVQNDKQTTEREQESLKTMKMLIGDKEVTVEWENNESVDALKELAASNELTINMSMYGGFEQVGSIGASLPRNDVQIKTSAGDIVLYSGDQIVVFYGSNSWAYTRLGRIVEKSDEELAEMLGNGDVVLKLQCR